MPTYSNSKHWQICLFIPESENSQDTVCWVTLLWGAQGFMISAGCEVDVRYLRPTGLKDSAEKLLRFSVDCTILYIFASGETGAGAQESPEAFTDISIAKRCGSWQPGGKTSNASMPRSSLQGIVLRWDAAAFHSRKFRIKSNWNLNLSTWKSLWRSEVAHILAWTQAVKSLHVCWLQSPDFSQGGIGNVPSPPPRQSKSYVRSSCRRKKATGFFRRQNSV